MSRQPYGLSPAEREELARMLPAPADRDLPAGRRPVLKEHLMQEIEQQTPPGSAPAPARRGRRRLTAIAVPVAIAAATGAAFTVLGGGDAKPAQAGGSSAGGSTTKIVNANYSLEKDSDGWVVVQVKITSKLDQARIRADFERVGIASSWIFVARDDCDAVHPPVGHRKAVKFDTFFRDDPSVNGSFVWRVKPSAIPAGYSIGVTLREVPRNSGPITGVAVMGVEQGAAPACMPTHSRGSQQPSPFPPGPTRSGVAPTGATHKD